MTSIQMMLPRGSDVRRPLAKKDGLWITKGGAEKVARTGFWRLISESITPGDLNAQISELLANCTDDLSKWEELTARFDASVFCGIFMLESNEGTDLSPANLKNLGLRNLRLSLDIYDPTPSD